MNCSCVWVDNEECSDCLSLRDSFFCNGWSYGSLWEDFYEHICDIDGKISSDCLENLTNEARDKVINAIDECWEEDFLETEETEEVEE